MQYRFPGILIKAFVCFFVFPRASLAFALAPKVAFLSPDPRASLYRPEEP
jgi:hypothetical protein